MRSQAKTVEGYLNGLPPERAAAIAAVREVILKNLPPGYEEAFGYGMIVYQVPFSTLPDTYNGQPLCYAGLTSQKNYMSLYLMNVYGHKETEQWFRKAFKDAGKKLDMGKSCVHFKSLDDLPLDVIAATIARTSMAAYVRAYRASRAGLKSRAKKLPS
jgi:hypothetical protein